ncbi:PREDICTED: long-chain-fatty-acid--CoA ligase ACSBG1-like, partial [Gekko japonicus]|uniref:Long-chain-fatty-acid--CoA ligase ACSBG1-like n=1 Tax=Gekko japonicus TaxID=146911 RepID=A0ABM1K9Z7_GEKJA
LLITAGGENVPPLPIEDAVKKELPFLSNAVLVGDRKKFLSMLLTLKCVVDLDTSEPTDCLTQEARDFCEKVGSKATKASEIVRERDPAVYRAIREGIDRVNARAVANVQRVQKWAVLEKDFSIAGGEF